jgi:hypothetical protein
MCVSASISGVGFQIFAGGNIFRKKVQNNIKATSYVKYTFPYISLFSRQLEEAFLQNKLKATIMEMSQGMSLLPKVFDYALEFHTFSEPSQNIIRLIKSERVR